MKKTLFILNQRDKTRYSDYKEVSKEAKKINIVIQLFFYDDWWGISYFYLVSVHFIIYDAYWFWFHAV